MFPKSDLDTRWECAKTYGVSDEIWMVGSCSPNWAKDEVSKKCTNYEDFPGISVLIPVIGNNVTFRNRYCALCNNVDGFTPCKYDVDCDVIPPGDYTELESVAFMDSFVAQIPSRFLATKCYLDIVLRKKQSAFGKTTRPALKVVKQDQLVW